MACGRLTQGRRQMIEQDGQTGPIGQIELVLGPTDRRPELGRVLHAELHVPELRETEVRCSTDGERGVSSAATGNWSKSASGRSLSLPAESTSSRSASKRASVRLWVMCSVVSPLCF